MQRSNSKIEYCLTTIDAATCADGDLLPESVKPPGMKTLSAWFRCLSNLQHIEDSIADYCQIASRAINDPGGLDGAMLLLNGEGDPITDLPNTSFEIHQAMSGEECEAKTPAVCHELLTRALAENTTIYHSSELLRLASDSDSEVTFAVAPIRNQDAKVTGFLYGWRANSLANNRSGIRELEAHFVRLVANCISTTLVRHQKETLAWSRDQLLVHAFPRNVIEQLKVDPNLFEGREGVVTTLFADLRGFTGVSNRLPTRQTYALINEVMDVWTEKVLECSGAVVDYYGDGMVAFWNAPLQIENHAAMAIICANKIRESLHELSLTWGPIICDQLDAGIGISTGEAQVGNCGSRHRFKYGPHGAAVNLAARLEKMTKEFGIPVLMSSETAHQSQTDFVSRRIGKAKVRGFENLVDVYEPIFDLSRFDLAYLADFEEILSASEASQDETVKTRIKELATAHPDDMAVQMLWKKWNEELVD